MSLLQALLLYIHATYAAAAYIIITIDISAIDTPRRYLRYAILLRYLALIIDYT